MADPDPCIEGSRGADPALRIGGKLTLTPAQERRRLTLTPPREEGEWLTLIPARRRADPHPCTGGREGLAQITEQRGAEPCPGGRREDTPLVSCTLLCCARGSA